mmetsp:Transcript_10873/g.15424  ORF Transcript_10873/g.15424 Transcript_10873/m.15424 type:complete len:302 (+) Transcript_10873:42-947(+)
MQKGISIFTHQTFFRVNVIAYLLPPDLCCLCSTSKELRSIFNTLETWRLLQLNDSKGSRRSNRKRKKRLSNNSSEILEIKLKWKEMNRAKVRYCSVMEELKLAEREDKYMKLLASHMFSKDPRKLGNCQHSFPLIFQRKIVYESGLPSTQAFHPSTTCKNCKCSPIKTRSIFCCVTCEEYACECCFKSRREWHPPHCFVPIESPFTNEILQMAVHFDVICNECNNGIVMSTRPLRRYESINDTLCLAGLNLPLKVNYIEPMNTTAIKSVIKKSKYSVVSGQPIFRSNRKEEVLRKYWNPIE